MNKLQNPEIPEPTQAIEIDKAINETLIVLNSNLDWLTNGYGKAYRFVDIKGGKVGNGANSSRLYYPEIYTGNNNYHQVTPDNDKKGQCFFIVEKEEINDFDSNQYNFLSYNVGIVFNANLSLISKDLANNEDFTQILIAGARDVLTRRMSGKSFNIEVKETVRNFREIYKEFSLDETKGYLRSPMTAFRINCKFTIREDCGSVLYDRNQAILQNISQNEILQILLPTLDFSNAEVFNSLSAQQKSDIQSQL